MSEQFWNYWPSTGHALFYFLWWWIVCRCSQLLCVHVVYVLCLVLIKVPTCFQVDFVKSFVCRETLQMWTFEYCSNCFRANVLMDAWQTVYNVSRSVVGQNLTQLKRRYDHFLVSWYEILGHYTCLFSYIVMFDERWMVKDVIWWKMSLT